jgi:hypothetical protein
VLVARELEPTIEQLREELGLGEAYRDPAVGYFGLANAVFAIGDTFLEVVCPVRPEEPGAFTAVRQLDRSGTGVCGYMVMIQVDDLDDARERARAAAVREVFHIELPDIAEVHLHPADMRGAIVSVSVPRPSDSWRWGGENWAERSVAGGVTGITVAVDDAAAVGARWAAVAGGEIPGCSFVDPVRAVGIVEIDVRVGDADHTIRPEDY